MANNLAFRILCQSLVRPTTDNADPDVYLVAHHLRAFTARNLTVPGGAAKRFQPLVNHRKRASTTCVFYCLQISDLTKLIRSLCSPAFSPSCFERRWAAHAGGRNLLNTITYGLTRTTTRAKSTPIAKQKIVA
jgi:hypothetical protein